VLLKINNGVDNLLDPDKPHFNPWLWLQCRLGPPIFRFEPGYMLRFWRSTFRSVRFRISHLSPASLSLALHSTIWTHVPGTIPHSKPST
jgi:hypothetical protein